MPEKLSQAIQSQSQSHPENSSSQIVSPCRLGSSHVEALLCDAAPSRSFPRILVEAPTRQPAHVMVVQHMFFFTAPSTIAHRPSDIAHPSIHPSPLTALPMTYALCLAAPISCLRSHGPDGRQTKFFAQRETAQRALTHFSIWPGEFCYVIMSRHLDL